jgi:ABC-2 type transport system permease protein
MLLGVLGGAMVPGELFGEPMSTITRLMPHYWAIDPFRALAFRGASIADILVRLGVLVSYAAVLAGIGIWGMRRALTRG